MTSLPVRSLLGLALFLSATISTQAQTTQGHSSDNAMQALELVTRQLMQLQSHVEDSKRTGAGSGIKAMTNSYRGNRPYLTGSYAENTLAGIHNHADHTHSIGLGGFSAVLHGVEFTTRHNDYKMKMRSTTSGDFDVLEDVPLPEVPQEVLSKATVDEEIEEMREWFKAWAMQDHSVRDYRQYFRAVLCYLEGAWHHTDQSTIEESFDSDRHFLDASSWLELQEKATFNMETGHKDLLENIAVLPTRIIGLNEDGIPQLGQWNYKILCHPLNDDLPLNRFEMVDDLQTRMTQQYGRTMKNLRSSKVARFQLNVFDEDNFGHERGREFSLLDSMMLQIPGMDNHLADITDDAYGTYAKAYFEEGNLNAGFYHHWYKTEDKAADGLRASSKPYNDGPLYMAMTTQPAIVPSKTTACRRNTCETWTQRWSYAVPLEIIYTTPLTRWNPYNLQLQEDYRAVTRDMDGNRRNGNGDPMTAYNGTTYNRYYQVPGGMFIGKEVDPDPADTADDEAYVLDGQGEMHLMRASGHRLVFPELPGLGNLRQRYPIFPLHDEGSATWKELSALKDATVRANLFPEITQDRTLSYAFYDPQTLVNDARDIFEDMLSGTMDRSVALRTRESTVEDVRPHVHYFTATPEHLNATLFDLEPEIQTSFAEGHSHVVTLSLQVRVRDEGNSYNLRIADCDGQRAPCLDGHGSQVVHL